MADVSMVILAGGKSSRMGRDKADLLLGEKTFLEIQIEKGRDLGITDILVSGYRGDRCTVPVIKDRFTGKGPLGGLESCFRVAKNPYVLVLCVDVPLVPEKELKHMICLAEKAERPVILRHGDRSEYIIGVYPAKLADDMVDEIVNGRGRVYRVLENNNYLIYETDEPEELFRNVNDQEEYEHLLKIKNEKKEIPFNIPVEEAKQLLLDAVNTIGTETIRLEEGLGRVSATEIRAKEDIPSFDRSPLDGYAVRSADLVTASKDNPVILKVQEEVPAGYVAKEKVKDGCVVKICTGAPIPEGADAIVKFEDTEFTPEQVTFFASVKADSNIVRKGSDISEGRLVLNPGKVLDPADLGMLASLGYPEIEVYRRPQVVLLSTGDELVSVGEDLAPGKIRNSSAYLLKGILEKNGCQVKLGGIIKDTLDGLETALRTAMKEADIVITTGGVSVGDYDYTPASLKNIGAEVLFWKTRLKPGMATVAAIKDGQLIVGLSGNPSAAAAGLYRAVMPALYKFSGREILEPQELTVTFLEPFKKKSPGGRVLPGRLEFKDGKTCIRIQSKQENGMISNWGGCNVLALVEKGRGPIEAGESCSALYLG